MSANKDDLVKIKEELEKSKQGQVRMAAAQDKLQKINQELHSRLSAEAKDKHTKIKEALGIVPINSPELHQWAAVQICPADRCADARVWLVKIVDTSDLKKGTDLLGVRSYKWYDKKGRYLKEKKEEEDNKEWVTLDQLICTMDTRPKNQEQNKQFQAYIKDAFYLGTRLADEPLKIVLSA